MRRVAFVSTTLSIAFVGSVPRSSAQDINAMAKWTAAGLGDMKLRPDGKSIVAQTAGWTWTFMPTIVK